jgi:large subunit ribosomal protein L9
MKVILLTDIERLGEKGAVVNVRAGFARNYLLPQKKAIIATASNIKYFTDQKNREEQRIKRRTEKAKALAAKLATLSLKTTLPIGEAGAFGAITNSEIGDLLKQAGYEIDKHAIFLEKPINEPGIHDVLIKLAPEVTVQVKLWVTGKKQ